MNKTAVNSLLAIGVALGTSAISTLPAAAAWMFGTTDAGQQLWCTNAEQGSIPSGKIDLCADQTGASPTLDTLLLGSPGNPTGNVELGTDAVLSIGTNFETKRTTLTGTVNGKSLTLSSLIKSDWTNNGNALAIKYLTDAIIANNITVFGSTPSAAQIATLAGNFITNGGARRFSNPNIEYINAGPGEYTIGLAGVYNATSFLNTLFGTVPGINIPAMTQASEVVKIGNEYLYSFNALPSGLSYTGCAAGTPAGACSYTGDYPITVPEPSSLLGLLVMGGGLLAVKRGKKS